MTMMKWKKDDVVQLCIFKVKMLSIITLSIVDDNDSVCDKQVWC